MLKRIWAAYSDFITLNWLLRRMGNDPMRVVGVILMAGSLFVFYARVLSVHDGETITWLTRTGPHIEQITEGSRLGFGCFACVLALLGFIMSLPFRGAASWTRISIYHLRLLRRPLPLLRLAAQFTRKRDPWIRYECLPDHRIFAAGSLNPFPWYFTRALLVEANGIGPVCNFLRSCQYVSDDKQFGLRDHWQHPKAFEACRRGDCEDHALWAWRKLCDAGVDAEFFVGRRVGAVFGTTARHAWVIIREPDGERFLECVSKSKGQILMPLADVRDDYVPYFSVDRSFRQWIYDGYLTRFSILLRHTTKEMRNI